jgi:hypothetical protein
MHLSLASHGAIHAGTRARDADAVAGPSYFPARLPRGVEGPDG